MTPERESQLRALAEDFRRCRVDPGEYVDYAPPAGLPEIDDAIEELLSAVAELRRQLSLLESECQAFRQEAETLRAYLATAERQRDEWRERAWTERGLTPQRKDPNGQE